jgi:hypothetical protein
VVPVKADILANHIDLLNILLFFFGFGQRFHDKCGNLAFTSQAAEDTKVSNF